MEKKDENNRYMWVVFSLTMLGWLFNGLDQMIFAMVAPWIMQDWKLTTVELGLIGSLFLVGHASGSIVASVLADYFGRKPILWITTLIDAVFTSLAGFAKGLLSLGLLRMLAGLGTGGQWPVGLSILSENVPTERRGRLIGLMNSGYPLGFLLSIAVTGTIGLYYRNDLGEWAWKICFFVGAVPGLITVLFMVKYLRESELWLRSRASRKENENKSFTLVELFTPKLIGNTITALVIQIAALMCYWGVAIWSPTYLATERGLTVAKMTSFMALWVFGAWVGQVAGGFLNDRFGRKPVLSFYFLGIALFSLLYGYITSPTILFWVSPITGFFVLGIFGPAMAYTTELFPTSARASGVGLATGLGRTGAILAPTLVGVIATRLGIGAGFYAFSAIAIFAFVILLAVGPETKAIEFK
jgi:MFS family permease